jgi:hypothetical protein
MQLQYIATAGILMSLIKCNQATITNDSGQVKCIAFSSPKLINSSLCKINRSASFRRKGSSSRKSFIHPLTLDGLLAASSVFPNDSMVQLGQFYTSHTPPAYPTAPNVIQDTQVLTLGSHMAMAQTFLSNFSKHCPDLSQMPRQTPA